jgi:hypothetical protein
MESGKLKVDMTHETEGPETQRFIVSAFHISFSTLPF